MAKAIINGNEIFGNVHIGEGGDVANPNIADVYDPTQTYNTGDRRIYDDVLYVCNDDNVTGAWDSTKWDSATIDEIISALTADDIPYSAGVSVADKLDSLNNNVASIQTLLGGILKVVTFPNSASISIAANSAANITANDMNISTPTGYTPIAIASIYCTSNDIVMRSFNCYATGTSSFGVARNVSGNVVSAIFNCAILYAKTGAVV